MTTTTVVTYMKNMPVWARWMLYALVGVVVLNIVQGFDDTSLLTAEGSSRAMLRWGVPILLAGLGGLFAERAGVVNIGLEGMMILGTWFGAWGALQYGAWWGLVFGALGGAMGGLLHALATVQFGVDHVISGVAINILGPGVRPIPVIGDLRQEVQESGRIDHPVAACPDGRSIHRSLSYRAVNCSAGSRPTSWDGSRRRTGSSSPTSPGSVRGLTSNMSWVTVFAVLLIPFATWLLWRTRFGLRLRIAGERPGAGEAQGINIYFYKYIGVIISGALSGHRRRVHRQPGVVGRLQGGSDDRATGSSGWPR